MLERDHRHHERPAHGEPDRDGDEDTNVLRNDTTTTATTIGASSGSSSGNAIRYARTAPTGRPPSISISAYTVAAWTRPSPSSVSAVPIATTSNTNTPAASPSVSMPEKLEA